MVLEGALLVGSISVITLAVSRFKCLIKKNGTLNWGCACMEKPLIPDDDDLTVKEFDLGAVKGLYIVPKHINHNEKEPATHKKESESESSDSE